ncbi:HNH endonuclease [Candidatus Saccharibacteria bacterium]|nr:HNH endonuclease [Candidatus Saccharibacteria bacterium]
MALLIGMAGWVIANPKSYEAEFIPDTAAEGTTESTAKPTTAPNPDAPLATEILAKLEIKGRAPKTGYTREQFYNGWPNIDGCSLRQRIIKRDFGDTAVMDTKNPCNVIAGSYNEPYTGIYVTFAERSEISKNVQIDHVVALSDAWQKGAQNLTRDDRYNIATDPLNLLATDAAANMKKGDGDAATWLPANKKFRCQYVARQVSVKYKYSLWVTQAEYDAIAGILNNCPAEPAVGVTLP